MTSYSIGKLYLIPTTMELWPDGCFAWRVEKNLDFSHYIVENEKTAVNQSKYIQKRNNQN
jgi:hypothetical protein